MSRSGKKMEGNNNNEYKTNKHYRSKSVPAALTNTSKSKSGPPLSVLKLNLILFMEINSMHCIVLFQALYREKPQQCY